jgi:hypothetical protein
MSLCPSSRLSADGSVLDSSHHRFAPSDRQTEILQAFRRLLKRGDFLGHACGAVVTCDLKQSRDSHGNISNTGTGWKGKLNVSPPLVYGVAMLAIAEAGVDFPPRKRRSLGELTSLGPRQDILQPQAGLFVEPVCL